MADGVGGGEGREGKGREGTKALQEEGRHMKGYAGISRATKRCSAAVAPTEGIE